jgi:biotin transport system substrate-specific component
VTGTESTDSTLAVVRPRAARGRTRELSTAALIAALLAASAWIQIPLQPVPITLQVFFVVLAALLLTPGWAFGALLVYLSLGAIGVPVFSGGHGGLGVLAGPTGGYLFGFLVAVGLGSSLRTLLEETRLPRLLIDSLTALLAVVTIYAVGALQLAMVADLTTAQVLVSGVAPFIIPDLAKAAAAVAVAAAVRKAAR